MTNILRSLSEVEGEGVLSASICEQVCTMARFYHDQHLEECVRGGGEGVLSASVSEQVCTMALFDYDQHFEECVRGGGEKGCYQ